MTDLEIKEESKRFDFAIRQLKFEIENKQIELAKLLKSKWELKWRKISWNDLEKWLKENRPENDYEKNPVVSKSFDSSWGGQYNSYCKLNNDGELQIGAYYHNDHYPRGTDLFIRYDYKSWRD